MRPVLAAAAAFVLMEPVTYAVHRWVMHGPGMVWHRSHHGPRQGRWEANDRYPVVFALLVGGLMAVGFNVEGWGVLVAVGVGITLYGAAYALVHDGWIHRRLPGFARRPRTVDGLAEAHALHHRFGGEPYGMLFPVVPQLVRDRAARDRTPADTVTDRR